jgi:hypothetical protein
MGRLGSAEEVADVIVFIASPRAHLGMVYSYSGPNYFTL